MKIKDFKLERYFAQHEFTAKYLLSSSDCDGFAMKDVLEVATSSEMDLWNNLTLGYTDSSGHPILGEAILQHYAMNDIDNVVVASPGELNYISMNVLLNAGDHVISVAPAYQSLYEIVQSLDCDISFWHPDSNWKFDVNILETMVRANTKVIIINFPHNPTGAYLTLSELEQIITIARKHNITIFSDEMYHKLVPPGTKELPPICDLYENGISLWGTSKTFGLAGLRTGWVVSQNRSYINKVIAFKDYLSICNSAPSEILSIIGLNHIDHFLLPNLQKITDNIKLFKQFSVEHDIIDSFIPPVAGSAAFVRLNIPGTALDFSNHLVKKAGIMTVPAEMFEYEGKYIRVGFGRKNFPEVLNVFSDYLRK